MNIFNFVALLEMGGGGGLGKDGPFTHTPFVAVCVRKSKLTHCLVCGGLSNSKHQLVLQVL
jgi:hypothetical protein